MFIAVGLVVISQALFTYAGWMQALFGTVPCSTMLRQFYAVGASPSTSSSHKPYLLQEIRLAADALDLKVR